jgi:hypothetical protein
MLDLAGFDVPPFLDGDSLAPHLKGTAKKGDRPVFIEFNRHSIPHDSYGGFQPIYSPAPLLYGTGKPAAAPGDS